MERLYLETPTLERKQDAIDYIRENYDYHSQIHGAGSLDNYLDDYEGWLLKLEKDRNQIPNEERVPAETYFLVRESDNRIVGIINIRLTLNQRLRESGGHIGYGIRPTERRKGYNKINLYLALEVCQEHGIEEVMLTCDKNNLGSAKTMQALGGRLTREFVEDGLLEQEYWINVEESLEKNRELYAEQTAKRR